MRTTAESRMLFRASFCPWKKCGGPPLSDVVRSTRNSRFGCISRRNPLEPANCPSPFCPLIPRCNAFHVSYEAPIGSSLPPYLATAPRQHVRPYIHAINSTHNGTLYEWCASVYGEPTRYLCPLVRKPYPELWPRVARALYLLAECC